MRDSAEVRPNNARKRAMIPLLRLIQSCASCIKMKIVMAYPVPAESPR
jgi:hypothetical protein